MQFSCLCEIITYIVISVYNLFISFATNSTNGPIITWTSVLEGFIIPAATCFIFLSLIILESFTSSLNLVAQLSIETTFSFPPNASYITAATSAWLLFEASIFNSSSLSSSSLPGVFKLKAFISTLNKTDNKLLQTQVLELTA